MIAGLLVVSLLAGFVVMIVNAKTSAEIQAEIDELEGQSNELEEQRSALEAELESRYKMTETIFIDGGQPIFDYIMVLE